ncbi:GNAT family N-acetyltransferase [candidate division KSB1 bacterium]|nr:GNAT family N-acetyltransferase [candidate division KSB1 bacterium]RQW00864.1 MAG: GNAT family N-acetyltransferase [candidate division KSB1 bacterium]
MANSELHIEYLPWDSDFFKRKIGRITIDSHTHQLGDLLKSAQKQGFRLIYLSAVSNELVPLYIMNSFNGKNVDTKIVYEKTCATPFDLPASPNVAPYRDTNRISQLHDLALQSGEYSRFRVDAHFSYAEFAAFYKIWLDNSLAGTFADQVFLYHDCDKIAGLITLKYADISARIGLLAVDKPARGKGIGTALLNTCQQHLVAKNIFRLQVTTQQANKPACLFYERNGFQLTSTTHVYHFWL